MRYIIRLPSIQHSSTACLCNMYKRHSRSIIFIELNDYNIIIRSPDTSGL